MGSKTSNGLKGWLSVYRDGQYQSGIAFQGRWNPTGPQLQLEISHYFWSDWPVTVSTSEGRSRTSRGLPVQYFVGIEAGVV